MKYFEFAEMLGALVEEKNEQYGDAINDTGSFLKLLFPDGIPVEYYNDIGVLVRVFDKMKRISNGHTEDSWKDIAGYGILMGAKNE